MCFAILCNTDYQTKYCSQNCPHDSCAPRTKYEALNAIDLPTCSARSVVKSINIAETEAIIITNYIIIFMYNKPT